MERAARRFWPRYAVGLVASLILLPGACSLGVVAWEARRRRRRRLGLGVPLRDARRVAAWAAAALPLRRLASPPYANSDVYRELTARHKELELVAETLDSQDDPEAWAVLQGLTGDREDVPRGGREEELKSSSPGEKEAS